MRMYVMGEEKTDIANTPTVKAYTHAAAYIVQPLAFNHISQHWGFLHRNVYIYNIVYI